MSEASDELKLGPTARLRIIRSEGDALEAEATYAPGSAMPPNHLHPAQDESFEILGGTMQVRLAGAEARTLRTGDTLEVPRGTPHTMWNAADAPAKTSWITSPAGRTEEWFRTLDGFQRRAEAGETVGPNEFTQALSEFEDVFRLVLE